MNVTCRDAGSYVLEPGTGPPGPATVTAGVPDGGRLATASPTTAAAVETPVALFAGAWVVTVGALGGAVAKTTSTK